MKTVVLLLTLSVLLTCVFARYENKFSVTKGCHQYYHDKGYYISSEYIPTSTFRHLSRGTNSTTMRMGILAQKDAHIRFSNVRFPFSNDNSTEFIIGGWENKFSGARRHYYAKNKLSQTNMLKKEATDAILSLSAPFMFTIEFHTSGLVEFTKDGASKPFFSIEDSEVSSAYLALSNWRVPVNYFFDCPLVVKTSDEDEEGRGESAFNVNILDKLRVFVDWNKK